MVIFPLLVSVMENFRSGKVNRSAVCVPVVVKTQEQKIIESSDLKEICLVAFVTSDEGRQWLRQEM